MYWDRANRGHGKCTGTELTGGMVSVLGQSYSWDRANRGHGRCTGTELTGGMVSVLGWPCMLDCGSLICACVCSCCLLG